MRLCSHISNLFTLSLYLEILESFSNLKIAKAAEGGERTTEDDWLICINWNNTDNACIVCESSIGAIDDIASNETEISMKTSSTRRYKASIWLRISWELLVTCWIKCWIRCWSSASVIVSRLELARGSAMNSTSFVMSENEAGTRAITWYTWSGRIRSIYKTKDKEGKWEVGAQRPYMWSDETNMAIA